MKDGSCEMIREWPRCYCMVVCVFGVCRAEDDLSQRAQDGDVSSAVDLRSASATGATLESDEIYCSLQAWGPYCRESFGGHSGRTRVCSDESRRKYEHVTEKKRKRRPPEHQQPCSRDFRRGGSSYVRVKVNIVKSTLQPKHTYNTKSLFANSTWTHYLFDTCRS